jgi:hypothetical protein
MPSNNSFSVWTLPQRRAYQRINTGFKWHKGEILRFLTLGSLPEKEMSKPVNECITDLYKRIRRLTPLRLYQDGYISKAQLRKQFVDVPLSENLSFDYCSIRTSEGASGVYHILYFGDFIPQRWLKDNWSDITGGCNSAYIKMCRSPVHNTNNLARYCICQYCINQENKEGENAFLRYSWSAGWVYSGFVADWLYLKSVLKGNYDIKDLINRWNNYLYHKKRGLPTYFEPPLEVYT